MKPHIASEVPQEDWELFKEVQRIISALPDKFTGPSYLFGCRMSSDLGVTRFTPSCHMVCLALKKFLPVVVHDGIVNEHSDGKEYQHCHSWLTRVGGSGNVIIDPWPLGSVSGPALFVQDYAFHFESGPFLFQHTRENLSRVATVCMAIRSLLARELSATAA